MQFLICIIFVYISILFTLMSLMLTGNISVEPIPQARSHAPHYFFFLLIHIDERNINVFFIRNKTYKYIKIKLVNIRFYY